MLVFCNRGFKLDGTSCFYTITRKIKELKIYNLSGNILFNLSIFIQYSAFKGKLYISIYYSKETKLKTAMYPTLVRRQLLIY